MEGHTRTQHRGGIAAGILFDRLAGPSWLARQFSGSTRGIITSALVGVAGAFIGYHIAVLLALGGGLLTAVIAAAAGAAVVLFVWRWLSDRKPPRPAGRSRHLSSCYRIISATLVKMTRIGAHNSGVQQINFCDARAKTDIRAPEAPGPRSLPNRPAQPAASKDILVAGPGRIYR